MRISILTEIPAPFRIPIFNALSALPDVELEVSYLGERQAQRAHYRLHEDEIRFARRVLPGIRGNVRGRWTALNVGVASVVRGADIVVAGGWNQPAFWQAAVLAKALRRPLVVWVESTSNDIRAGGGERAKRTFVRAADAVLVPGSASADYAQALGARRIAIAPNAVDTAIFRDRVDIQRARREELRQELSIDGCTFLFVGRLSAEKGVDVLLEALRQVPEAQALIVGAGPEQARLRANAPAGARFIGAVDRDELPRFYAAADALVQPSRSEPWGFAIVEAAVAGLPVVATSVAGAARELVEDGFSGFVVAPDDPTALAEALRRIAFDPPFRYRAGVRSRELSAPITAAAWAEAVRTLAADLQAAHDAAG